MEDEFLVDYMSFYLKRDLAWKIDLNSVVKEFVYLKTHEAQLS